MNIEERFREAKAENLFFEIQPDIYMIFQDKTSENFNSCNTFIIKDGNEITIIDPGCSRLKFSRFLKKLNISFTHIKYIILTHAHSDHYVLTKYLQKKASSAVYIHTVDRQFLEEKSKYIDFIFDRQFFQNRPKYHDLYQILLYYSNDVDPTSNAPVSKLNPAIKSIFDTWNIYSIHPDHEYKDGDTLPGHLTAVHLPGHTPGHCALLSPEHHLIFCADIDFNKRGPVVSSKYANINDFKCSLDRLIQLILIKYITQLYPSHWNPVFSNLEPKIKSFKDEFQVKENQILKILSRNGPMTVDEISVETFKDFAKNFQDFIDETTKDSMLVAEASDLLTNRNYLIELKRLNKIEMIQKKNQEYWKILSVR